MKEVTNDYIMNEIEFDSIMFSESIDAYFAEEENLTIDDKIKDNKIEKENSVKQKLLKKGNAILKKMKEKISDEDYLVNGFSYHSKMLYSMSIKFPLLSNTIGVPLMAITKAVTDNALHYKLEQDKILKVYSGFKGDKAAVDAKLEQLNKLQKPSKEQKQEIITLSKMSSELEFNMKRLEHNYKQSQADSANLNNKNKKNVV